MSDLFDLPFEDEDQDPIGLEPSEPLAAPKPPEPPTTAADVPVSSRVERAPRPATRRALSVTELTLRVRDLLEAEFLEVWVEGELSNCRVWNTGHLYFTLKDRSSQIRAVIFKSALRYLKFKPADGLRVIARGRVSVYEPKGEYQLVCEHLEPHGLGARQLAYDQLKKRLQDEGLFAADRKRALPALPRKVGIVTSLDGAAIHDIINVLRRRHGRLHLVIRPSRVQGEDAALEIARAIRAIGRVPGVEVLIVGRGGGSIEDLWAFNEEIVARAIASSPVPVISAVGHESDFTIADLVADLRAPTPSAAAELVVAAEDEIISHVTRLEARLDQAIDARLQRLLGRLHTTTARPAFAGFPARLAMRGRHAADLSHAAWRLTQNSIATRDRRLQGLDRQLQTFDPGRRLGGIRARLVATDARLTRVQMEVRHRADARLRNAARRLEALSPLAVLGRGYAVCWIGDRDRVVRAASEVKPGDQIRVTLSRGEIDAKVSGTHE